MVHYIVLQRLFNAREDFLTSIMTWPSSLMDDFLNLGMQYQAFASANIHVLNVTLTPLPFNIAFPN